MNDIQMWIVYALTGVTSILYGLSQVYNFFQKANLEIIFRRASLIAANVSIVYICVALALVGNLVWFILAVFYALGLFDIYGDRIRNIFSNKDNDIQMMSGEPTTVSVAFTINSVTSSGGSSLVNYTLSNTDTGYTEIHNDTFPTLSLDQNVLSTMDSDQRLAQQTVNFLALTRTTFEKFVTQVRILIANNDLSNLTGGVISLSANTPVITGAVDL